MAQSPCFLLPLLIPSLHPSLLSSTYLETLLAVIGSRPPWSQVTRELTSPFSTPPHSSPFQIPSTLLRFPQHPAPTKTTTRLRLPRSGAGIKLLVVYGYEEWWAKLQLLRYKVT